MGKQPYRLKNRIPSIGKQERIVDTIVILLRSTEPPFIVLVELLLVAA